MPVAKMRKKKDTPKEKPIPCRCKCGKVGIPVKLKGGWIVSCPDPENCSGNFMTLREKRKM